jgi:hypothetical protein
MVHHKFKNGRTRKTCPQKQGGYNPLTTRPQKVKTMVSTFGSKLIIAVKFCRQPISSRFTWILQHVSPTAMKTIKEEYGYDKLFHLYMILYLEDGTSIRYEKNERVSVSLNKDDDTPKDCTPVIKLKSPITVSTLVDEYEKIGSWRYDVEVQNCQTFALDNAHIMGITNQDTFIKQNLNNVLPRWVKFFANIGTDISALADYAVGNGFAEPRYDFIIKPPLKNLPVRYNPEIFKRINQV